MLGFISGWVQTGAMEGSCSSICACAARGEEAVQERTWAVLSLVGSASLSAPKVPICAAVLAIGKVTLLVSRISKAVLLVLVERRSRLIKLERLSIRPATTVGKAICSLLKGHMVRVRSITADHGQEFAAHGARSRMINAPFFLADRYRSWQRGRVENAIGLGRAFIPKRTDLRNYSHRRIRQIENNPDSRPMKLHDWLSRSDGYANYRCCAK